MIRLALAGTTGRTGRYVLEAACRDDRFAVVSALTKTDCPTLGTTLRVADRERTVTATLDAPCDVLIDFTVADGTMAWLKECEARGLPMVIGATGSIGAVCSRLLAQAVRDVVLVSLEPEKLIELKRTIEDETRGAKVSIATRPTSARRRPLCVRTCW